jgi:hypothetical protein
MDGWMERGGAEGGAGGSEGGGKRERRGGREGARHCVEGTAQISSTQGREQFINARAASAICATGKSGAASTSITTGASGAGSSKASQIFHYVRGLSITTARDRRTRRGLRLDRLLLERARCAQRAELRLHEGRRGGHSLRAARHS